MIRSELVRRLAENNPAIPKETVDRAVATIFGALADALIKNRRIELRNFGTFTVMKRSPYIGRNPQTGESIEVTNRRDPRFKVSATLNSRLQLAMDLVKLPPSRSEKNLPRRRSSQ